jgi:hypothetical protein
MHQDSRQKIAKTTNKPNKLITFALSRNGKTSASATHATQIMEGKKAKRLEE